MFKKIFQAKASSGDAGRVFPPQTTVTHRQGEIPYDSIDLLQLRF